LPQEPPRPADGDRADSITEADWAATWIEAARVAEITRLEEETIRQDAEEAARKDGGS
jgi:hypothetical protein